LQNLLVYFCDCKKRKGKTKQVCDCNYLASVIANQELCVLQKNLTLSVCLQSYLVVWNMIASLDSASLQKTKVCDCTTCLCVWLQKTKVCDCKICWFISVTAKKEKRTEPLCDCKNLCLIATRSYVWLQKKENLTLSVWLKSYLVIWNMIASLGSKWLQKLKCVIAKIAGLFLW
jgi:hypothetical protein